MGGHGPVEIVNVRVSAHGLRSKLPLRMGVNGLGRRASLRRDVILTDARNPVSCAIIDRSSLVPGNTIEGPAIIEEDASTVLLLEGDRATVSATGEIVLDVGVA